MAAQLPNAWLIVEEGGGHTALLNRSRCIDDHALAYLVSGDLPDQGTSCAGQKPILNTAMPPVDLTPGPAAP